MRARAEPGRSQIDVVRTMSPQQEEAVGVGGEGQCADGRHGGSQGRHSGLETKGGLEKDAHTEVSHDQALEQRGSSAPGQAPVEIVDAFRRILEYEVAAPS